MKAPVTLTSSPLEMHAAAQALVWGDRTARKGGYASLAESMNALHDRMLLAQLEAPQAGGLGDMAADLRAFASDYLHGLKPDVARLLAIAARLEGGL